MKFKVISTVRNTELNKNGTLTQGQKEVLFDSEKEAQERINYILELFPHRKEAFKDIKIIPVE